MKISLIYFNFPFWRAEVARIALHYGGIDFNDIRISSDEFQQVKTHGKLNNGIKIPFHQLPCLVVDDIPISQTAGIARFCGKLSELYPMNDNIIAARIDQFIDMASDITSIISFTKPNLRDKTFVNEISRKLFILNKSIPENNSFIVDNKISICDIAIWSLICWLTGKKVEGIPANILQDFANIHKICLSIDKNTKINDWINKTYPDTYLRSFNN